MTLWSTVKHSSHTPNMHAYQHTTLSELHVCIVLNKLFKLYCCSFYGSQMWRLGSVYFNKVCTAWNIAVREICNLPHTTHRWFLGLLMNQPHISYQFPKRCIRFLHNMKTSQNEIVLTCYRNAVRNANTPIRHNVHL